MIDQTRPNPDAPGVDETIAGSTGDSRPTNTAAPRWREIEAHPATERLDHPEKVSAELWGRYLADISAKGPVAGKLNQDPRPEQGFSKLPGGRNKLAHPGLRG